MSLELGLACAAAFILASGLVLAVAKVRLAAIGCVIVALATGAAAPVVLLVKDRQEGEEALRSCLREKGQIFPEAETMRICDRISDQYRR